MDWWNDWNQGIGTNDECDWNEWMIRLVFPLLSVWSLLRLLCLLPVRLIVDFGGRGRGGIVCTLYFFSLSCFLSVLMSW